MSLANLLNATAGGLNQGCWKRKGSEDEEDIIESDVKKARYSWYVTLESESPQPTSSDEDEESVDSIQEHETEYARDTSDTSTNTCISSGTSEDVAAVEYDVASLSEEENPLLACLSTSDSESQHIIRVGMIAADIYDSDIVLADDSDDSRSSCDSEISLADYRTCMQCHAMNNNPLFRYCEKCFQNRKNFFPPRPRGKKRRPKRRSKNKTGEIMILEGHELTTLDSGLGSTSTSLSQSSGLYNKLSQESVDSVATTMTMCTSQDSNQEGDETIKMLTSTKKLQLPNDSESNLCVICTVHPKDGVLVHGRTAHISCCYRCAKKAWKTTKHCPICNRKLMNVLKAYG